MKMTHIKVRNMTSPRGNKIANQFIIETENGRYFQSYQSIIALIPRNNGETFYKINPSKSLSDYKLTTYPRVYLDESDWDYSVTTGKYRNQFLGEGIAETRKKIASGEYKLANLN